MKLVREFLTNISLIRHNWYKSKVSKLLSQNTSLFAKMVHASHSSRKSLLDVEDPNSDDPWKTVFWRELFTIQMDCLLPLVV